MTVHGKRAWIEHQAARLKTEKRVNKLAKELYESMQIKPIYVSTLRPQCLKSEIYITADEWFYLYRTFGKTEAIKRIAKEHTDAMVERLIDYDFVNISFNEDDYGRAKIKLVLWVMKGFEK